MRYEIIIETGAQDKTIEDHQNFKNKVWEAIENLEDWERYEEDKAYVDLGAVRCVETEPTDLETIVEWNCGIIDNKGGVKFVTEVSYNPKWVNWESIEELQENGHQPLMHSSIEAWSNVLVGLAMNGYNVFVCPGLHIISKKPKTYVSGEEQKNENKEEKIE